jgi:hypothetical protein
LSLCPAIPNIDSGATPIGSAGHTPDRKIISRKNSTKRDEEEEYLSKEEEEGENWSL